MFTGLLLLPVRELADTEAEYLGLRQIASICLASFLVYWHQAASLLVVVATLARVQWIRLTYDANLQASVTLKMHLVSCEIFNGGYVPQICNPLPPARSQVQESDARALHGAWWPCELAAKTPSACENVLLRQYSCPFGESGAPSAAGKEVRTVK